MSEILCLHIGQAGVQIGQEFWQRLRTEHSLSEKWTPLDENSQTSPGSAFFSQTSTGAYIPRGIFVDTDYEAIEHLPKGLFNPDNLIKGRHDSASCFAQGYAGVGREVRHRTLERIRKALENCDKFQGFLITHALGGGTGSGLAADLADELIRDNKKALTVATTIFPSPTLMTSPLESMNAVLCTEFLTEQLSLCLMLENQAMYRICESQLSIEQPSYVDLDKLVALMLSAMTSSIRFQTETSLNGSLAELVMNLVPFPKMHFVVPSLGPLMSADQASTLSLTVDDITSACLSVESRLLDGRVGKTLAATFMYEGLFAKSELLQATTKIQKTLDYVEWSPCSIKCGAIEGVPGNDQVRQTKRVLSLCNSTGVVDTFKRVYRQYEKMKSRHAFWYWYLAEGIESGFIPVQDDNLNCLIADLKAAEQT